MKKIILCYNVSYTKGGTAVTECQRIERTIIKAYRKTIWQPFVGAVKEYRLLNEGDRVAVCISGGKDSFLLAKCIEQLHRHSEFPFELTFLCIDPGYTEADRAQLEALGATLALPLVIEDVPLFRVVQEQTDGSPCYLCARMRRGWLYKLAQKHGCNKIALGHHRDDVVETALMSMLYGAEVKFYSARLELSGELETALPGLFAAGDGAGVTRGLAQAGASGIQAARAICNRI